MENLNKQIQAATESDKKEVVFLEEMVDRLTSSFAKDLEGSGYSPEELAQFALDVNNNPDKNYLARLLAVPKELRLNLFLKNKTSGENLPIIKVLDNFYSKFVEANQGKIPKLGYHTSEIDFVPEIKKDPRSGVTRLSWDVPGTEESDLGPGKRAHAADSFASIYREKAPHWLYVVRLTDEDNRYGEGETSWHHSGNFAIIDKFNLAEVDESVANRFKAAA